MERQSCAGGWRRGATRSAAFSAAPRLRIRILTAKIIRVNNPERLCRFPLAPVATLRVTDDISVSYDRDKLPPINTHCCCFILILQGRNIARHRVTTTQKGWQATLDLRFQQAGGKTVLASAQHVGPLTVQRPFYPEEETCHPSICFTRPAASSAVMS